jgi:hypothetical protein
VRSEFAYVAMLSIAGSAAPATSSEKEQAG